MTMRHLMTSVLRRWYAALGILLAAAGLFHVLVDRGGIYTTTTVISFDTAARSTLAPYNGNGNKNVISFAGSVAQQVNRGRVPQGYAHSDAPLYGAGIRKAALVWVPNDGGQWANYYPKAEIDIEIVGPDEAWVKRMQSQLVREVLTASRQSQASLAVSDAQKIDVSVVPATLQIQPVTVDKKSKLLSAAALGVAAALSTGWSAVTIDRIVLRRARRTRDRDRRKYPLTVRSSTA